MGMFFCAECQRLREREPAEQHAVRRAQLPLQFGIGRNGRISAAEAAKKAGHPNGDDIPALWRKIRKIERLRKGCKGTNASLLN